MRKAEQAEFPLLLWQDTAPFNTKMSAFQRSISPLARAFEESRVGYITDKRIVTPNGYILAEARPWNTRLSGVHLGVEDALRCAKQQAYEGYWTLAELNVFLDQEEGFMLDAAMMRLGYAREKNNKNTWFDISDRSLRWDTTYLPERTERLYGVAIHQIGDPAEKARLNSLRSDTPPLTNEPTSAISATRTGMLYISGLGHIYRQQQGFFLEAENIKSTGGNALCDGVLIRRVDNSGGCREVVWPNIVPTTSVNTLACSLL